MAQQECALLPEWDAAGDQQGLNCPPLPLMGPHGHVHPGWANIDYEERYTGSFRARVILELARLAWVKLDDLVNSFWVRNLHPCIDRATSPSHLQLVDGKFPAMSAVASGAATRLVSQIASTTAHAI